MTIDERIFQIDGHELILRNANEEDAQMLISGLKLMCGETRFLAKEPEEITFLIRTMGLKNPLCKNLSTETRTVCRDFWYNTQK